LDKAMLDAISNAAHNLYDWVKEKLSHAWHWMTG
jgi:hypothetical protein